MSNEPQHIKKGLEKLLNSKLIKDVYPMVDKIRVVKLNLEKSTLFLDIQTNTDMTYENMYDQNFDPHYLVDRHLKNLLPFLGVKLDYVSFDIYDKNNNYVFGYQSPGKYFKPNSRGIKTEY